MRISDTLLLQQPAWLLLLGVLPWLAWRMWKRQNSYYPTLRMPMLQGVSGVQYWRVYAHYALWALRVLAFVSLVLAMARPQSSVKSSAKTGFGIDIVMAIDLSSSMLSKDFSPDRISVTKTLASEFVANRPAADRVGVVIFAGEAVTLCPLSLDKMAVKTMIEQVEVGILADKTAIGMGLAQAVNRIKDSDSRSKIIILLSDGSNTTGYFQPMTAAGIAKELGVRVYTIGIGTDGMALSPFALRSDGSYVFEMQKVEIDEELLMNIANETGGRYYRAKNIEGLSEVYSNIDQLEKTIRNLPSNNEFEDKQHMFIIFAFALLLFEFVMRHTFINSLP